MEYISFEEFVYNSQVGRKTVEKNHKKIPGIIKKGTEYIVMSGTRYPYNLRRTKLDNSESERLTLLELYGGCIYKDAEKK